jgi:hypothetical protein
MGKIEHAQKRSEKFMIQGQTGQFSPVGTTATLVALANNPFEDP